MFAQKGDTLGWPLADGSCAVLGRISVAWARPTCPRFASFCFVLLGR